MHPQTKKLIEATYAEQRSKEWHALRHTMLTASDAATTLGLNPYETPEKLIYKKCGAFGFRGNAATLHGQTYEPLARDMYMERTREVVHEIGLVVHPEYPWIGGSPDGVTENGRLIEIKCPLSRKINGVPKHYIPQVQILLEVLDLEVCDFVQLNVSTGELTIESVQRDREWFADALPKLKDFWGRVVLRRASPLCEIVMDETVESSSQQPVRSSFDQTGTCTQSDEADSGDLGWRSL